MSFLMGFFIVMGLLALALFVAALWIVDRGDDEPALELHRALCGEREKSSKSSG